MVKRLAVFAFVIGALAVGSGRAEAVAITGSLSLSAQPAAPGQSPVVPISGNGILATIGTATGIDFAPGPGNAPTPGVNGSYQVDSVSAGSSFMAAGLLGTTGTIKDFSFSGSTASYPGVPITTFESGAAGFQFDLLSITSATQVAPFINITGTGLFHLTGFDNTPGTFAFTITNQGTSFSFAAAEVATPTVPEPGSMVLLGTGLMGLGASLRRRFTRKS